MTVALLAESTKGWAEIITASAKDPLGILALTILVLGTLAATFFANADIRVRVGIFVLLFAAVVLFGSVAMKQRNALETTAQRTADTGTTGPPTTTSSTTDTTSTTETAPTTATDTSTVDDPGQVEIPPGVENDRVLVILLGHQEAPSHNENKDFHVTEEAYVRQFANALRSALRANVTGFTIAPETQASIDRLHDTKRYPIIIALHAAAGKPTDDGTMTYVASSAPEATVTLAQQLQKTITRTLGTRSLGVQLTTIPFKLLKQAPRSIHLELFHLPNDADYQRAVANQDELAKALADKLREALYASP